ncbi:MAG: hypothetical protein LBR22_08180 [Desulfovibrio sp.]|jgi:ankyrin repeat protein|nr:hypothetical protein [Desulfovibrio sp.]
MSSKKHAKKENASKMRRRKQREGLASRHEASKRPIEMPVWTLLHLAPDAPQLKLVLPDGKGKLLAHFLAEEGLLPEGFQEWHWPNAQGDTIAHVAVKSKRILPDEFTGWDWRNASGTSVARLASMHDVLPASFDKWDIMDLDGPITHTVARRQRLPPDFDKWEIRDARGRTPAHEAADVGKLPKDFHAWHLADNDGWTVAHAAALANRQSDQIPEDAKDFSTNLGIKVSDVMATVASISIKLENLQDGDLTIAPCLENACPEIYLLKKISESSLDEEFRGKGVEFKRVGGISLIGGLKTLSPNDPLLMKEMTVENRTFTLAHYAAITEGLPEGFSDWAHKNNEGSTVAHWAALAGTLPENFNDWRLTNENNESVAELWIRSFVFPKGFNDWEIPMAYGTSLLHKAIAFRRLPEDFDKWGLDIPKYAPDNGKRDNSAAFFCAYIGAFPKGFDKWDIRTEGGWTVAHEAASRGTLPEDISDEILALREGKEGPTVAETVLKADIKNIYPPLVEKHKRLMERIESTMETVLSEKNKT